MEDIIIPEIPELSFEERKHVYYLDGIEIPSMSTIMKPLSDEVYGSIDQQVLDRAAGKGTIVHNAIDTYLEFGFKDIPEELIGYFDAFLRWFDDETPEVVATERRVYHKALRYAGTCDLLCVIGGKLTLVDYKTSYAIQPMTYPIQLEGYSRAWETHGVKVEEQIILHLKKDGRYSVHRYPSTPETYSVLYSLATLYNYRSKFLKGK